MDMWIFKWKMDRGGWYYDIGFFDANSGSTLQLHWYQKCDLQPAEIQLIELKPSESFEGDSPSSTVAIYGGFLKWWYPQIMHFHRISIINYPAIGVHCKKPPYIFFIGPSRLITLTFKCGPSYSASARAPLFLQRKRLSNMSMGRVNGIFRGICLY